MDRTRFFYGFAHGSALVMGVTIMILAKESPIAYVGVFLILFRSILMEWVNDAPKLNKGVKND